MNRWLNSFHVNELRLLALVILGPLAVHFTAQATGWFVTRAVETVDARNRRRKNTSGPAQEAAAKPHIDGPE